MSKSHIIEVETKEHSPLNIFGRYEATVLTSHGTSGNSRSEYSREKAIENAADDAYAKEAHDRRRRWF